jgi:hypothetical protein
MAGAHEPSETKAAAALPVTPRWGRQADGWQPRLLPAPTAARGPFLVLHERPGARVHLGELAAAHGRPLRFAWKLRTDSDPVGAAPRRNAEVDDAWARERLDAARVRAPQAVAPMAVPADLLQSPPLWWCKQVQRAFHPVCPTTGALLRDCRDDAILLAAGLPRYAEDHVRYLHSGAPTAPAVFYRAAPPTAAARPGLDVRGAAQLVRDFGRLVHGDPAAPAVQQAALALPCLGCAERHTCYPQRTGSEEPAIPAEQQLVAISFHDVDAVATPLCDFDFDEAGALLGGGLLEDLVAARAPSGRDVAIDAEVRAALSGPGQWLLDRDPARWLLEVLRQKVAAALDLVAGLAAVHALGRPHLGLVPGNVLVAWRGSRAAPARWQFQPMLHDFGSAVVASTAGSDARLVPGPEVLADLRCRPFVADVVRLPDGQSLTLPVACYCTASPDGFVHFIVEAEGGGVPRSFVPGDCVLLQPVHGGQTLQLQLEDLRPQGLRAAVQLNEGHPCLQWDGLQFEARLSFHRRLGTAADLHGLGMLLLQLFTVHDQQRIDEVGDAVLKCLRRLEDEPTGVRLEERSLVVRLCQLLGQRELRLRLDPTALLHRSGDRDAVRAAIAAGSPPLDPLLWQRLLVMVCKLLTTQAQLGYARSHAESATAALVALRTDLEALHRRLGVELFTAPARDQLLQQVCARHLAHLQAAATTGAALPHLATASGGIRLAVCRDGDTITHEHVFEQQCIRIGRREGEVDLRLADPMVSSWHATIELMGEGWCILDRNSTNGTEVDGIRLPGEVPQPLQDGSVIYIRPFRVVFRDQEPGLDSTSLLPQLSADELWSRLADAAAGVPGDAPAAVETAVVAVLRSAQHELGRDGLVARLEAMVQRGQASPASDAVASAVATQAVRAFDQLARSLVGGELRDAADVQAFAGRLARFVEVTSQWIARTLELRRALGKHLDLGFASTAGGAMPVRTAADVRAAALGVPGPEAPPAEATGAFLARFYDDLMAVLEGLLRGNQQVRRAVRERLEPQRLVETANREAKLGLLVQAAANSALWKLYVQAFQEVTGDAQYEQELAQLLQKALQGRVEA